MAFIVSWFLIGILIVFDGFQAWTFDVKVRSSASGHVGQSFESRLWHQRPSVYLNLNQLDDAGLNKLIFQILQGGGYPVLVFSFSLVHSVPPQWGAAICFSFLNNFLLRPLWSLLCRMHKQQNLKPWHIFNFSWKELCGFALRLLKVDLFGGSYPKPHPMLRKWEVM